MTSPSKRKYFINKGIKANGYTHTAASPLHTAILEVELDSDGNPIGDRDVCTRIVYHPTVRFAGVSVSEWYRDQYEEGEDQDGCMIDYETLTTRYEEITRCKARKFLDIKFWPQSEGLYTLDGLLETI